MQNFFRSLLLVASFSLLLGSALPAAAEDHCWCRIPSGTCEHHVNADTPGDGSPIVCGSSDSHSCTAYCTSRGWTAAYCDPGTYLDRTGTGGTSGVAGTCPTANPATPDESAAPTQVRLYNPLGEITIPEFISRGIQAFVGIIGALALLMMVAGGVMWMTAGDSDRVKTAKSMIVNSAIGLLLIFFSYTIIAVFFSLLRP